MGRLSCGRADRVIIHLNIDYIYLRLLPVLVTFNIDFTIHVSDLLFMSPIIHRKVLCSVYDMVSDIQLRPLYHLGSDNSNY